MIPLENSAYSAVSAVNFEGIGGLTPHRSFAVFVAEFVRIPELNERDRTLTSSAALAKPVAHNLLVYP